MKYVLGLSFNYHDSSACLVSQSGELIACIDEERLTRKKHDNSFPSNSIDYLFDYYSLSNVDILAIAYYEDTEEKKKRVASQLAASSFPSFLEHFPNIAKRWSSYISDPISQISDYFNIDKSRIFTSQHHLSHICSSIFTSGFSEGVFVTLDGVGETTTGTKGTFSTISNGAIDIQLNEKMVFPHSIGLFYTAITQYLGFEVNEGEYKVMGLAPYGLPLYKDRVLKIFAEVDGLNTRLKQDYFCFRTISNSSISPLFSKLMGVPPRVPESDISLRDTQSLKKGVREDKYFYADFAASCQSVVEDIILQICHPGSSSVQPNLVCSGGVFYNSVANGKLVRNLPYENVHIYPAAGDSGNSVGAAYAYFYKKRHPITPSQLNNAYLGRSFNMSDTVKFLDDNRIPFEQHEPSTIIKILSELLLEQKVIAAFHGRAEHGPRALGNRSIIASPMEKSMKDVVNAKIKFRELFRPFAPATVREYANQYFDLQKNSKLYEFMLATCQVNEHSKPYLKATTHIDGSARVQVVDELQNQFFYNLIHAFGDLSGTYCLLNTSFNVRGEPIVDSMTDAISTFYRTDIDALYLNGLILLK